MIARLIGALVRATALVLIIASPAFLLPNVSTASQEITLIVAGIAAAFTVFEYASTHPGLIDFRFAPPYNRVRYTIFGVQVLSLVFLCRAEVGVDGFAASYLALADQAVALTHLPFSPVALVSGWVGGQGDTTYQVLITRAAALSFLVTFLALAGFALFLWIIPWPIGRRDFNLWINLPTFEPGYGRKVERRLYRDGIVNIIFGVVLIYLLPLIAGPLSGWFNPNTLGDYQGLVWGTTLWAFISGSLVIRGAAILKVSWLVRRTRRI
ncbi:MAG: hypothetical protein AAF848_06630 [Pseudomonadota bacterium]